MSETGIPSVTIKKAHLNFIIGIKNTNRFLPVRLHKTAKATSAALRKQNRLGSLISAQFQG
ncbi:hypothetical protein [Acidovorax sp. ACV01]|uniref:hypothetical protein n=1 Tax=Acidovorax sp. ACV01 TaxID=2769311 RepID=UPI0017858D26|nr:hypothetical protein [Acidovorax sp. ACV01]MBD9395624.1 hypothetical protein [Acidovorax sp. ACV01]